MIHMHTHKCFGSNFSIIPQIFFPSANHSTLKSAHNSIKKCIIYIYIYICVCAVTLQSKFFHGETSTSSTNYIHSSYYTAQILPTVQVTQHRYFPHQPNSPLHQQWLRCHRQNQRRCSNTSQGQRVCLCRYWGTS